MAGPPPGATGPLAFASAAIWGPLRGEVACRWDLGDSGVPTLRLRQCPQGAEPMWPEHQALAPPRVQPGTLWGTEQPLPLRKLRAGGRPRALPWGEPGHPRRPAIRTAGGGHCPRRGVGHSLLLPQTDRDSDCGPGRPETKTQPGLPGEGEPRSSEPPRRAVQWRPPGPLPATGPEVPRWHQLPAFRRRRSPALSRRAPLARNGAGPGAAGVPGSCWGRSVHPLLWGQPNGGHGHSAGLERRAPGFRLQREF